MYFVVNSNGKKYDWKNINLMKEKEKSTFALSVICEIAYSLFVDQKNIAECNAL